MGDGALPSHRLPIGPRFVHYGAPRFVPFRVSPFRSVFGGFFMRSAWFAAPVLALVVVAGCSQSKSESSDGDKAVASSRQAIQGGASDTTHTFAVGVCRTNQPGGQCYGICSGALIGPNLV